METNAEFKLPMMGKSLKLKPLPGQDPQREYGVIWDACRQPGEGWGYVFEFTGKRTGRILAWLTIGGAAYACDGPLAFVPAGEPDLEVSRLPDTMKAGHVEARVGEGYPLRVVSQFHRTSGMGAFAYDLPACDLGSYTNSNLDFRTFLAVGFLAFVYLPRESGVATPGGLMDDVVDELLKPPLPDACDLLVHRVRSAQPGAASGFELYAARLLEEAGSARLRGIATHADIEAGRLSTTGLVWIRFDGEALSAEERGVVLAVESALNRLIFIEESVRAVNGFSGLYAGYDEGFCSQRDWRCLCGVASVAAELMRESERGNDLREVFDMQAAQGGEWDVRTRFSQICEGLRLPYRLEYRFDVDAAAGVVNVECSVPRPEALPATRWDAAYGAWTDVSGLRGWTASAYAMRLAAALAGAAFGAGVGISRAFVTVRPGGLDKPAGMSLTFDRIAFAADVLPRIEAGALGDEAIACDPGAVLALLAPADRSAAFLENGFFAAAEPLDAGLANRRPPLWEDERALPEALAGVLRADKVCELDVLHDEDAELTARVSAAMGDAEASPLAGIVQLEELAAQLDKLECARAAGDAANAAAGVPLYCVNPSARVLVSMLDGDAQTRYRKASDAAFAARSGLARLYLRIGDVPRAIEAAESNLALAPTSVPSYSDAAAARMDEGRFDEAEALLRKALRFVFNRSDCYYLCYRLAYALWRQKRYDVALACYAAVVDGGGAMASQARSEMDDLMEQLGVRERPSNEAAHDLLVANGISTAPAPETARLLARAAVGLTDAGFFRAAAPAAHAVALLMGDDALLATAHSLENDM